MAKSKQQKEATISTLTDGLKNAKAVVFANFQGLTVAQTEDLRKKSRAENVSVVAAKKTLVKRALEGIGLGDVDTKAFQGGVAVFMGAGDEVAPAKVVSAFAKSQEIVKVYGGVLEGKFIDAAMVKTLSAIPGKKELLSKMVGSLNAPISGFVQVNAAIVRGLFNVLNAYKDKKPA